MQPKSPSLLDWLGQNRRFLLFWAIAAVAFRVIFLHNFALLTNDSFVYGEIAKNWLQHGIFGQTFDQGPEPTFIRMPGYPLFLAVTWLFAGIEHYHAALIAQIAVDVLTCFAIADLARRIASPQAAKIAFVAAALCPFLANYASVALTETWSIFFAAAAMDLAVAALDEPLRPLRWIACGLALSGGILMRPDGGMLLAVIAAFVFVLALVKRSRAIMRGLLITSLAALAPLIPWTLRNWRTFHIFQPLTPFNANMPWEFVPHGFQRWARTWIVDYASLEDVWFKVDGEPLDIGELPIRAWDNDTQRNRTELLFNEYNANGNTISPAIDHAFEQLASERIHAHPMRYYLGLPLLRAADLWLRPRTEMLPIDPHWWRLRQDDPAQFRWALLLGSINLMYIAAAMATFFRRHIRFAWLILVFALVRTAFLAWLPNPEPRYVLECYPALIAVAGAVFSRRVKRWVCGKDIKP